MEILSIYPEKKTSDKILLYKPFNIAKNLMLLQLFLNVSINSPLLTTVEQELILM